MKRVLITGIAGFIGFHLAKHLHDLGDFVVGIDAMTHFYSKELKKKRAAILEELGVTIHYKCIDNSLDELVKKEKITHIAHLAAQPGIRHSLNDPWSCFELNGTAFFHVLEACRQNPSVRLVYASSSSVYGETDQSCCESGYTDAPTSLYAAMKKSNELMAYTYHHLHHFAAIGLRFFTVYGPWGRPDMAYYIFTEKIDRGEPINLFNNGHMQRDFTYIDDIISGTVAALDAPINHGIFNLGKGSPDSILSLVSSIEDALGKRALTQLRPRPATDVLSTHADVSLSKKVLGYAPTTTLTNGINAFVSWYTEMHAKLGFSVCQCKKNPTPVA